MIRIELGKDFSKTGQKLADQIEADFERLGLIISGKAEQMLEEYANGRDYVVSVDGKNVPDKSYFNQTRKSLIVTFKGVNIVDFAVSGFKQILQRAIRQNGPNAENEQWINAVAVRAHVRLYYLKAGQRGISRLNSGSKVDFSPGDAIFVTPEYPTQVYANAGKYGATGFMKRAASTLTRKINRKYGYVKGNSPFSVRAERRNFTFVNNLVKFPNVRRNSAGRTPFDGITVPKPALFSAWTLVIRYRDRYAK